MGADPIQATVKYNEDPDAALQRARLAVFESGEYNGSDNNYSSIDDIFMDFELMEAGGTGTIIDITSVGELPEMATATPLTVDELTNVFGTTTPTQGDLHKGDDFFGSIERGHCRYLTLHDDAGKPTHIHFSGYTWD